MNSFFTVGPEPCGIRAELLDEIDVPGLDGRRWEFLISDDERSGTICADIPGSACPDRPPSRGQLEAAIESFAGCFAVEHRLQEMLIEYRVRGPYAISVDGLSLSAHRPPLLRFAA
jgi:hypothetical protein